MTIPLTIAVGDYDHTRDLAAGKVGVQGVDLTMLAFPVEEIFHRFIHFREWDVSEMSFAKYVSFISQGDDSMVGLPIFPSRVFRHSSIFVRADSDLAQPQHLAGKRVGVPEWAQTAAVYSRGLLAHEYGVDLASIRWFQGGVNDAGRKEKTTVNLPAGVNCTSASDRSLSEMLLAGDLDAVLSARPPAPFLAGDPSIRLLFSNSQQAELAYWRKTGIFPIMHLLVMRRDVFDRNRWVAMNLLEAFEEAKNRSLARAADRAISHYPIPWTSSYAILSKEIMGPDFWPYGIEANRPTLEAFTAYAFEQGVCACKLAPEALFPKEVQTRVRV